MTRFAHVSDLHFGRHDPAVADALAADLRACAPDVVVVSGDLTQRARDAELVAARAWLDALGVPWLAVPGNHDLPLFDLLRRFLAPLARWHRRIGPDDDVLWTSGTVALLGLNTARRTRWKEGRISHRQIDTVRARFLGLPEDVLRVLVTHHPFLPAPAEHDWTPMARGEEALLALRDCRIDLMLSGHQHRAYSADVTRHYEKVTRALLVAHAGTSISTRTRGEPNTWNLFAYRAHVLDLEVRTYADGAFAPTGRRAFERADSGWRTRTDV